MHEPNFTNHESGNRSYFFLKPTKSVAEETNLHKYTDLAAVWDVENQCKRGLLDPLKTHHNRIAPLVQFAVMP